MSWLGQLDMSDCARLAGLRQAEASAGRNLGEQMDAMT